MLDLDIGMNDWLCQPFAWDDSASYDRGKVMTAEELRPAAISAATSTSTATASPTAPIPARIPTKGAFFTRGTSRDRYARYTEEGADYVDNMERLLRKFETAKRSWCRGRSSDAAAQPTRYGVIYTARPAPAMHEALERWRRDGHPPRRAAHARLPVRRRGRRTSSPRTTRLRRRAEPRRAAAHAAGQRGEIDPARLVPSCTTTARRSPRASSPPIAESASAANVLPLRKAAP
jgi:2-oxoglutarate/2-oxoacid ferredoxin oxidoreductase subunit alpha